MNLEQLTQAIEQLRPHAISVALILARLAPVCFLCPVLGGRVAPVTVRLSVCLGLALHLHLGGLIAWDGPPADLWAIGAAFAAELLLGVTIGIICSLPFDAARMGGRFLDTFRGANAEAVLPATGSQEAATGDLLYQLLCAVCLSGFTWPLLIEALGLGFRATPLGVFLPHDALLASVLAATAGALSAGLAIGAPAAAASLIVELAMGVAARVAPQLPARELAAPAKLMLGSAAILLALGAISARLQEELARGIAALHALGAGA